MYCQAHTEGQFSGTCTGQANLQSAKLGTIKYIIGTGNAGNSPIKMSSYNYVLTQYVTICMWLDAVYSGTS